jgi:hypothetical protein
VKIVVSREVTQCSWVVWCQRFGGACRLHQLLASLILDMKYEYVNVQQRYADVTIYKLQNWFRLQLDLCPYNM